MALIIDNKPIQTNLNVIDWHTHNLTFSKPNLKPGLFEKTLVVHHWTGGEGGYKQVHNVLKNRGLSVQFFIAQDGTIYQYCDVKAWAFGAGYVNKRAISIEIGSKGMGKPSDKYPRTSHIDTIRGKKVKVLDFYDAQTKSAKELTKVLCAELNIPLVIPQEDKTYSVEELNKFNGVCGHYHISLNKTDCGSKLLKEIIAV